MKTPHSEGVQHPHCSLDQEPRVERVLEIVRSERTERQDDESVRKARHAEAIRAGLARRKRLRDCFTSIPSAANRGGRGWR